MTRTNNHHIELFRKAHISILGCSAHFLYNPRHDKQQSAMRPTNLALVAAVFFASLSLPLQAQQLPAAITTDPGPDKTNPAAMQSFQIPSH